jgi:hypothetical protein
VALFDAMKAAGVPPNAFTFASLIAAFEKGGRWRQVRCGGGRPLMSVKDAVEIPHWIVRIGLVGFVAGAGGVRGAARDGRAAQHRHVHGTHRRV